MKIWHESIEMNIATLNSFAKDTMLEHLGIEFTEIGDNFLIARMPVDKRTKQPAGIMHGGASAVLAETIGSTAGNCCVDYAQFYCVGLDINTNHIRAIKEGAVIGVAKPFHIGRSSQVWGIEIFNEKQQLISVNRLTLSVLSR